VVVVDPVVVVVVVVVEVVVVEPGGRDVEVVEVLGSVVVVGPTGTVVVGGDAVAGEEFRSGPKRGVAIARAATAAADRQRYQEGFTRSM